MEQLKQAITIIKIRWQEVVLIFGLFLFGSFAMALVSPDVFAAFKLLQAHQEPQLDGHILLYILFSVIISLVSLMLYLGFMSTVHLQGSAQQTAAVLLKTGQKFFFRIFACMILYIVTLSFLMTMTITFLTGPKVDSNLYTAITIFIMLILLKPTILIPALIIVLDCGIFKSFGYIRDIKLSAVKELIILFFIQLLILVVFSFNSMDKDTGYYILSLVPKTLVHFIRFLIFIIAVRLVSSYNLQQPSADKVTSQGLLDQ